jgi:hypothetical protein
VMGRDLGAVCTGFPRIGEKREVKKALERSAPALAVDACCPVPCALPTRSCKLTP